MGIENILELVGALPTAEQTLFERLFTVTVTTGELKLPLEMHPWATKQFGSVAATQEQKIVRVTNNVTGEETLINRLRAARPFDVRETTVLDDDLEEVRSRDVFAHPLTGTPEDTFGRISGKHCITASNVSKYDALHGLIIFNDYHPLKFSREQVIDYLDTGLAWAHKAHSNNPEARYYLFVWNCLWRAGASINHGHAQVTLAAGRHYARIERLRQAALYYRKRHGSNYFDDLYRVHDSLGCAGEKDGTRVLTYLAPFKDNEVIIMGAKLDISLKDRIYKVLASLRDRVGVRTFNLSLVTAPFPPTDESWEGFPVMVRIVDRGDPDSQACDVGSMEIYGASVVASDPFKLARKLAEVDKE